jgi:monofunctional biosynthetic peptidoglycan transglycosylase
MIERALSATFARTPIRHHYTWQPIEKISHPMRKAVIAAEDQRFLDHNGFDWAAIRTALTWNERHEKTRRIRGASTISQQTAKNLFLWSGRTWLRKGLETGFTVLIECLWPKERILEIYLNIVEFGDGIYGVEAAAQYFFKKPASKLSSSEAALLAAALPNPHTYRVNQPNAYMRGRQTWILRNMSRISIQKLGQS